MNEAAIVKERLDIAEVIQEYVPLRRFGQHFKALCPFHQEKTPSFVVSPQKGIWHCFGCGEGGDVFGFVQKVEGIDFLAALKLLAERAGVTLSQRQVGPNRERRQRLYDVLQLTSRFYQEILLRHTAGKQALAYLKERGVKNETLELFQLGYAPHQGETLIHFLNRRGFTVEEMMATGLVSRGSGGVFARFRGRIVFPIQDVQGRVVGFGGRIVPWLATGHEGKYINSPDTALYAKRRVVYNLHRAKHSLRKASAAVVVEGYMDVVMMTQADVPHVVASSGTAFTQEQIGQLKRFTSELHFAFDGDAAGWKATQGATQAALAAGMRVATIPFPAGQDPADVALQNPGELRRLVATPKSLIGVMLERLHQPSISLSNLEREQQLAEILPVIRSVQNPIQQGQMLEEVSALFHIPHTRLLRALENTPALEAGEPTALTSDEPSKRLSSQQYVIGLLLEYPQLREATMTEASDQYFLDDKARELYKVLQDLAHTHANFFTMMSDDLLPQLPAEHQSYAEGLRVLAVEQIRLSGHTPSRELSEAWSGVRREWLTDRLKWLMQRLPELPTAEQSQALREFQGLAEELEATRAQS